MIRLGAKVKIRHADGEEAAYLLVSPAEADPRRGRISEESPIGRALLNKTVGDEVEVQAPAGRRSYQIIGLVTLHESAAASGAR